MIAGWLTVSVIDPNLPLPALIFGKAKVGVTEEVKEPCSNDNWALPFGEVEGFLHGKVSTEVTGPTELSRTLGTEIID